MKADKSRFTLDMHTLFQKRLKVMAALKGITMREYCLAAIEKELARDEAEGTTSLPFGEAALDRLASLQEGSHEGHKPAGDSVELIREVRNARSKSR
jgi:hypothetical protein